MAAQSQPRWWEVRRAQNTQPKTYRCPLCGGHLPALSEHMLIVPEADRSARRHAHTACVMTARRQGRLPTRKEWQDAQPTPSGRSGGPGMIARLRARLRPATRPRTPDR